MSKITLTFDNGPTPEVTAEVLDILAARGIKTTFYVRGKRLADPGGMDIARRALDEGHWIGNHTWFHETPLGKQPAELALSEVVRTTEQLALLPPPSKLFRPMGSGVIGPHLMQRVVIEHLIAERYTCVLWDSVPGDFRDPHGWMPRGLADIRNAKIDHEDWSEDEWLVQVLHDIPTGAMAHLPAYLDELLEEGHSFVQEYPGHVTPVVGGKIVASLEPYCVDCGRELEP